MAPRPGREPLSTLVNALGVSVQAAQQRLDREFVASHRDWLRLVRSVGKDSPVLDALRPHRQVIGSTEVSARLRVDRFDERELRVELLNVAGRRRHARTRSVESALTVTIQQVPLLPEPRAPEPKGPEPRGEGERQ